MKVGDRVTTDYTGKVTEHTVIEMREQRPSQSGIGVRVDPPLRTWRDTSNQYDEWPREFYDIGWFTLVTQEELFP